METLVPAAFSNREAVSFVKVNRYKPRSNLACCIDGRYESEPNLGSVAMAGGDLGPIMSALALLNGFELRNKVKQEAIVDTYIDTIGGPRNFRFHTDNTHTNDSAMGCAHFRLACENPTQYYLIPQNIDFLRSILEPLVWSGAVQDVLHGGDFERAVFTINDPHIALQHQDRSGQAFVYQAGLTRKRLEVYAKKLYKLPGLKNTFRDQPSLTKTLIDFFDTYQAHKTIESVTHNLPKFTVSRNVFGRISVKGK